MMELTKEEIELILRKYLDHVFFHEGIDYLNKINTYSDCVQFTAKEVEYLSKLETTEK